MRSRSSAVSDRECQDFSRCSLWLCGTRRCDKVREYKQHHYYSFALPSTQDTLQVDTFRCVSRVSTSSEETVCDSFRTLRVLKPPSGSLLLIVSRNSGSARLKQGEATGAQVIPRLGPITEGARFSPCCYCCSPFCIDPPQEIIIEKKTNSDGARGRERGGRKSTAQAQTRIHPPPPELSLSKEGGITSNVLSHISPRSSINDLITTINSTLPYITPTWIRRNDWQPTNKQAYISTTNDYTFDTRSIRRTTPVLELVADWKRATTFLISLSSFATSRNKGHRLIRPHIP